MKRLLNVFICISLVISLSSCVTISINVNNDNATSDSPDIVKFKDLTFECGKNVSMDEKDYLEYYYISDTNIVPSKTLNLLTLYTRDTLQRGAIDIFTNKHNKIVELKITGRDIETYRGLHIGDSENMLKLKFEHLLRDNNYPVYTVVLDGAKEIEPDNPLPEYDKSIPDSATVITYVVQNESITEISIHKASYYRGN